VADPEEPVRDRVIHHADVVLDVAELTLRDQRRAGDVQPVVVVGVQADRERWVGGYVPPAEYEAQYYAQASGGGARPS
jgi:hypothetical protein